MGYVFISYSTANQESADAIRNLFSKHGFATWMAPYDIPPGQKYAEVINRAIKGCDCFTLLLTQKSQDSVWVAKEVERAVHYRKLLIPISLESVVLNDEFEFYISTDQIVPVKTISEDSEDIRKILQTLSACLGQPAAPQVQQPTPAPQPEKTVSIPQVSLDDPELDPTVTDHWAQYRLAFAYEFGDGKPQNYRLAVKWYLLAAAQENSWAQNRLGDCYYYGHGVEQSYEHAVYWYERGANNDDNTAQYNLAHCYYQGKGVPFSYAKAFAWYLKSANLGLPAGQYMTGYCYLHSKGVAQDLGQAFRWLKQAANQSYKKAYPLLAQCYEEGLGVAPDLKMAAYWRGLK